LSCNCRKTSPDQPQVKSTVANDWKYQAQKEEKVKPTEQCLICTYKHFSEAYCQFTEYGYLDANRTFVIGNLRAMVLHTFSKWKDIAKLARETALLVQDAKDEEALRNFETLDAMVKQAYYKEFPEAKKRLDELKEKHNG